MNTVQIGRDGLGSTRHGRAVVQLEVRAPHEESADASRTAGGRSRMASRRTVCSSSFAATTDLGRAGPASRAADAPVGGPAGDLSPLAGHPEGAQPRRPA